MKRCTRCLYPDTKPNLWFNADGLCSACIAFDLRASINWGERAEQFNNLMRGRDVVVASSGGKDSTWMVVKCLELGLRPLAVTATTDHLSDLGRRNLDNIANLCDTVEVTPNKTLRRRMARHALETVGDISWCEHVLIWTVPAAEAARRGIPFVLYGENPQAEYGAGPAASQQARMMGPRWEHEFGGLLGLRVADMAEKFPEVPAVAFDPYRYVIRDNILPPMRIFMGSFFPWDGYENAAVAAKHGFEFHNARVEGSWGHYENLDNLQTGIHDYLRYLKFGYGRAIDICSSQIRRGRMTRAEAVECCREHDGTFPWRYIGVRIHDILEPLKLDMHDFANIVDRFTNCNLFEATPKNWPRPLFGIE